MRTPFLTCIAAIGIVAPATAQDLAQTLPTTTTWGAQWDKRAELSNQTLRHKLDRAAQQAARASEAGDAEAYSTALMDLAGAQHALGDVENAVRNSMRAVNSAKNGKPSVRRRALMQLSAIHLDAGHADRALELLKEVGPIAQYEKAERREFLRLDAEARSQTMPARELITYLNTPVAEAVKNRDDALQAELLALMARAHTQQGGILRAIELEDQVMRIALKCGNTKQAGISANNLAQLLRDTQRSAEAAGLFQQALILLEDDPELKLSTMVNGALQEALTARTDQAMRMLDEAYRLAVSMNKEKHVAHIERTRSALQFRNGDLDDATTSAQRAMRSAEASGDPEELATTCALLATLSERRSDIVGARSYQKQARDHEAKAKAQHDERLRAQATDLARWQRMEREQMEQMNRQQHQQSEMKQLALDAENQEKRLALLMAEKLLEESARREESQARTQAQQALALTRAALSAERSDRMIKDLENTRLLQSMKMDRLGMERKQREADLLRMQQLNEVAEARSRTLEAEQGMQRTLRNSSIAAAMLMLLFGGYMTWAWSVARKKKRTIWQQKKLIEGINEELAAKNHDIESSLRYAQTIQSAILPSEEDLRSYLPQSFMLYKPLDKVSGDLPFFMRVGNCLYVAAIDCTGHGVPAGMMTFIAYYGLSDLIKQHGHESCGKLLDRLHGHVKQTMDSRSHGGLYNDGMDIGLCRLNLDTGELNFAGAQLSLLILRHGSTLRIKGDLLPLGDDQFLRKTGYKDHVLRLEPKDRLFLFSDGIIHQFGGADGRKKSSLKRLNDLLEENAELDLAQLKEKTEHWFDNWKGETPQTDDVLMIGLSYAA